MQESTYYDELSTVTRQLANAYDVIAFEKEKLESVNEDLHEMQDRYEITMSDNEDLIQQIDLLSEEYKNMSDLIASFDEPAYNLIDQLLVSSVSNAAIPDYVNVLRRLMKLIYDKGIELKAASEKEEEFEIDEGILY